MTVKRDEIQDLINQYSAYVNDPTTLRPVGDWVEITTPYLDRHNDYLQIYVKRGKNGFILSDDGYILTELRQSGCDLEKRIGDLMDVFGIERVEFKDGVLIIHATVGDFVAKKRDLIQLMLAVN